MGATSVRVTSAVAGDTSGVSSTRPGYTASVSWNASRGAFEAAWRRIEIVRAVGLSSAVITKIMKPGSVTDEKTANLVLAVQVTERGIVIC